MKQELKSAMKSTEYFLTQVLMPTITKILESVFSILFIVAIVAAAFIGGAHYSKSQEQMISIKMLCEQVLAEPESPLEKSRKKSRMRRVEK